MVSFPTYAVSLMKCVIKTEPQISSHQISYNFPQKPGPRGGEKLKARRSLGSKVWLSAELRGKTMC